MSERKDWKIGKSEGSWYCMPTKATIEQAGLESLEIKCVVFDVTKDTAVSVMRSLTTFAVFEKPDAIEVLGEREW